MDMKRKGFNPIIEVEKDDFVLSDSVGVWSETKYNLMGLYCDIFTNSMHDKWENLVYIDLFSGCGFSRIEKTGRIILSSPLIAMSIPHKFNKYILCEENVDLCSGLQNRVSKYFNELDTQIINGDCNDKINLIIEEIPKQNSLCFCFVDPFNLKDLHFKTISMLGKVLRIDFLILIATGMDAKRNAEYHYLKVNNCVVENFLDDSEWREKYERSRLSFIQFLAKEYDSKMLKMGYKEPESFQQVKMNYRNIPLYHLAFYSKNDLGNKFWKEVKRYESIQTELF